MNILLIEDDERVADYLMRGLEHAGHQVTVVADGRQALMQALQSPFDIFILDRQLPGLDGLSLLKSFRAAGGQTPVIMLSSLASTDYRVEGLEAGADDYLGKPFSIGELLARMRAVLRRPDLAAVRPMIRIADLEIDMNRRRVARGGVPVDLVPKEFSILMVLVENEGRIVTKSMLLEKVWNINFYPRSSIVETHVSRLRAKIDSPFSRRLIRTFRGVGYAIDGR